MVLDCILGTFLLLQIQNGGRPRSLSRIALNQLVHMIGNRMKLLRSHDQIQIRQSVNELKPTVLSHAPQDANHEIRVRTLSLR